jgi:hypothetical protein
LFYQGFLVGAHLLGFRRQLRSALDQLNNNRSFLPQFLSTNTLDLTLTALTEEVKANAIVCLCINQTVEPVFEFEKIHFVHLALKDTVLHPLTKILQGFENSASTFVILNIVRNHNEHDSHLFNFSFLCSFCLPFSLQPLAFSL